MKHIYIVQITDTRFDTVESARAFTLYADAQAFIESCKEVEHSPAYTYAIDSIELDGDVNGCY